MDFNKDIDRLLSDSESDRAERTQAVNDSAKFCKAICAFANDMPLNQLPGYLFVGVNKNGEPTGAAITEQVLESLASHRDNGQIIPIPSLRVFKHRFKDKDIAILPFAAIAP